MEKTYGAGWYPLPDLTEKEIDALDRGQLHKLDNSAHVQKMRELVAESHSVDPTEIDGVVLAFDPPEAKGGQGYLHISKDKDGDYAVRMVPFLNTRVNATIYYDLASSDKDRLLRERFDHVPPTRL